MKTPYIFFSILVVSALACGSSTSTPAPRSTSAPGDTAAPVATSAPAATMGQVGDRIESDGVALTVHSVSAVDNVDDIFKPDAGNIFLVADVTIESVDKDAAAYNPLYFKVKDADGFEYNVTLTAPDPSLKSGELSAGEKARGNIAFEVPADATGLVLSYKPIIVGIVDPIEFDLGDAPTP